MMDKPMSVRLPKDLRKLLEEISASENLPVSDLVRESIQRYVSLYRFRQLRKKVLPFAEAQGLLTDEDVLKGLK
ncbi:CopG family ribbon-helix-helix protein [Candidatus Eisenbacteria bacterium]|uniref:CopG family ribbon-helix-helix protein n=1 Tax=Eiseniibacteriota bacterium TaxID=2212470 RepID=A0ABV6YPY5_UNCEI